MKVSYSQKEETFRSEIIKWLKENVPPEVMHKTLGWTTLDLDLELKWAKTLKEEGLLAPEFPKDMGGSDFNEAELFIFNYEYSRMGAPRVKSKISTMGMLAPLLIQFGTEEQKKLFIPDMLASKSLWAQGFSEPNAGSDLASLKTKAVLDGDEFIVNGQKIWTSMADHADWIFLLVRTDSSGKKQQGISFLLVDLKSPGITIRPIEALTDYAPFCEVFFEDVRVPKANLIGEINKGWTLAKALMEYERINVFPVGELIYAVDTVRKNAEKYMYRGKPLIKNESFRKRLADAEVEAKSLLYTFFRILSSYAVDSSPGDAVNILKVCGGEIYQKILDLNTEAIGPYGQSWYNEECGNNIHQATTGWINGRTMTIGGGSSEIQRTIIALRVLGLPR